MKIPLCRLVPMLMVKSTLACDLIRLEQKFNYGYEEGARVFYVSVFDEQGQLGFFTDFEKAEWGALWKSMNDMFNLNLVVNQSYHTYWMPSSIFVTVIIVISRG